MPITIYSEQQIAGQALAFLRNRFQGRDSSPESFLGKLARAFGMVAAGIQKSALDADGDAVPGTSNSTARLDEFAYVFGVPSSTPGSYGRKGATLAGGGVGQATGANTTVFPVGTQALGPDGVTLFQVASTVTIPGSLPGSGTVTAQFTAVTAGTSGNVAAGSTLTWVTPPTGADQSVVLTSGLSGATDVETDRQLLTRILLRLQTPPKGGVGTDYRQWSESIAGVSRAFVYPLRGGIGSVHTVLTGSGSGLARNPGSTVQTNVDAYINGTASTESVRPVTVQGYKSFLPYQPGTGLVIKVRVVVNGTANAFDWNDAGASSAVSAYTAPSGSTAASLTLTSLPVNLQNAITVGTPRIQVLSSAAGAPASQQVQVTANPSGNVLTLQNPLPAGFIAPLVGDLIYAGGPAVAQTANALLAYIDGLGPSRVSGTASSLDVWEDVAAIARIAQVTLDQVDASGNRFFLNLPASGVTINGAATDIQANDNTSNGPELLFARWVVVTS